MKKNLVVCLSVAVINTMAKSNLDISHDSIALKRHHDQGDSLLQGLELAHLQFQKFSALSLWKRA